jgi:GR25 family glycosyltransferase involved in LPS biosynthesis
MNIPTIVLTSSGSDRSGIYHKNLSDAGITNYRVFCGVNGKKSGLKASIPYEIDNPGSGYTIDAKHIGCSLSHWMLWKALDFGECGTPFWMVVEDDVVFRENWRERVEKALETVPPGWDMIYPGSCCTIGRRGKEVGDGLFEGVPLCTHCYIVHRRALPTLISTNEEVWAPIDLQIQFKTAHLLKSYILFPRVADQYGTEIHD